MFEHKNTEIAMAKCVEVQQISSHCNILSQLHGNSSRIGGKKTFFFLSVANSRPVQNRELDDLDLSQASIVELRMHTHTFHRPDLPVFGPVKSI
jgi:hypothetical protein